MLQLGMRACAQEVKQSSAQAQILVFCFLGLVVFETVHLSFRLPVNELRDFPHHYIHLYTYRELRGDILHP